MKMGVSEGSEVNEQCSMSSNYLCNEYLRGRRWLQGWCNWAAWDASCSLLGTGALSEHAVETSWSKPACEISPGNTGSCWTLSRGVTVFIWEMTFNKSSAAVSAGHSLEMLIKSNPRDCGSKSVLRCQNLRSELCIQQEKVEYFSGVQKASAMMLNYDLLVRFLREYLKLSKETKHNMISHTNHFILFIC